MDVHKHRPRNEMVDDFIFVSFFLFASFRTSEVMNHLGAELVGIRKIVLRWFSFVRAEKS